MSSLVFVEGRLEFSFPFFPLGTLLYTLGSPKVLFGGLIYFAFIHQKKYQDS